MTAQENGGAALRNNTRIMISTTTTTPVITVPSPPQLPAPIQSSSPSSRVNSAVESNGTGTTTNTANTINPTSSTQGHVPRLRIFIVLIGIVKNPLRHVRSFIKPFYVPPHKKPRHYGLQPPHDVLQVVAWILFSVFLLGFVFICLPSMHEWVCLPVGVLFFSFCLIWYSTNFCLGVTNSRDRRSKVKKSFYDRNDSENQDLNWCRHCEAFVHQSSKHCRLCDKCVEHFDHHCRWLNTCIGRKNYILFLVFVTDTILVLFFTVLVKLYLIGSFIFQYHAVEERVRNIYQVVPHYVLFGLQMFMCIFEVIAIIPVLQLWLFHAKLILRHQTTYEFIIEKRMIKDEYEAAVLSGDFPPPTKKWKRCVLLLFCLCPVLIWDNHRWRRFKKFQKKREQEANQWTASGAGADERNSRDYGRSMRYRGATEVHHSNDEHLDHDERVTRMHQFNDNDTTDHDEVTYRESQANDIGSTLHMVTSNDSLTTLQSDFSESRREHAHTPSARFSRSSINKIKPLDLRSSSTSYLRSTNGHLITDFSGKKRSNSLRDSNVLSSRYFADNPSTATPTMLTVHKENYVDNPAVDDSSTPLTPVLRGNLVSSTSPLEERSTPNSQNQPPSSTQDDAPSSPHSARTSTSTAPVSPPDNDLSSSNAKSRKRSASHFTPLSGIPSPKINLSLDVLQRKEVFKRSGSFRKYSHTELQPRASVGASPVRPAHRHSVQLSPRRYFPTAARGSSPSVSQSLSNVEALHNANHSRRRASAFATLCIADEFEFNNNVYDAVNSPSNFPNRLRPSSARGGDADASVTPDSPTENVSSVSIHLIEEQMPVLMEDSPLTTHSERSVENEGNRK